MAANSISPMNRTRITWGCVALILLTVIVAACITWGGRATAVAVVFGLLPDVSLIGAFAGEGWLKPARVRFYNLCHAPVLALAGTVIGVIVLVVTGGIGSGFWPIALAGLAWLAHIAVDRVCGFGLRAADGSIVPVGRPAP